MSRRLQRALKPIIILLSFLALPACQTKEPSQPHGTCESRVSAYYAGPSERTYCSGPLSVSSPVSVVGRATYQARPYTTSSGLGAIGAAKPIRHAEVVAYAPNGSIVQCGETDDNGDFTLDLPDSTESHAIKVFSRGENAFVKASVLECPEENNPYFIETAVVPAGPGPVALGTINADADNSGELLGAAFNIFDQFVTANEFLRDKVGSGLCNFTGCEEVSPTAPKVQAYWAKGFNPNAYYDSSQGISFYIPGYRKLFILGGVDGDIFVADTDHFDNSVILHEYGHFLEDVYTNTDSPGGSHSGNSIIDPRLAWGEGWGNFIQAAIRDEARYRDSEGTPNTSNPNSTSRYIFNIPIETPAMSCAIGSYTTGCDLPEFDYEGNFREFSVARMLWDAFDSAANTDSAGDETVDNKFVEIWAALTAPTGFLNPNMGFRNTGHLHEVQQALSGASNWSTLRSTHKQGGTLEYARYVDNTGSCSKYTIEPYDDPNDNGSFSSSHLVRNNDFYHYYHPGGYFTLTLKAKTLDVGAVGYTTEREADMDLYLYKESANYGNSSSIVRSSDNYWDNEASTEQTETLSVTNLAAGRYLINVKVFTGKYQLDSSSSTNNCIGSTHRICENDPAPNYNYIPAGDELEYELIANGASVCPATLP